MEIMTACRPEANLQIEVIQCPITEHQPKVEL